MVQANKELKKKIHSKLSDYRRRDKRLIQKFPYENKELRTISLDLALHMLSSLNCNNCPECGCLMLFTEYKPYEHTQFSFDRINEHKIHDITNLRVICYSCNASRKKTNQTFS